MSAVPSEQTPYRQPAESEATRLRREGADAVLHAAFRLLERRGMRDPFDERVSISPASLLIHCMWAVQQSADGLHYDIEAAEEKVRAEDDETEHAERGVLEPAVRPMSKLQRLLQRIWP